MSASAMVRDSAQRQAELEDRRVDQVESPDQQISQSPQHEDIARLAYALWQKRSRPADSAEKDWTEAEQQLRGSAKQL
jgi:Protein of unknown function (DUF2934)